MARDARGEEPLKAADQNRKCSLLTGGRGLDLFAAPATSEKFRTQTPRRKRLVKRLRKLSTDKLADMVLRHLRASK